MNRVINIFRFVEQNTNMALTIGSKMLFTRKQCFQCMIYNFFFFYKLQNISRLRVFKNIIAKIDFKDAFSRLVSLYKWLHRKI